MEQIGSFEYLTVDDCLDNGEGSQSEEESIEPQQEDIIDRVV